MQTKPMSLHTLYGPPPTRARDTHAPWWTWLLLGTSAGILMLLAAIAAWLSFEAQADYVAAHNGGFADRARAWALLLDAATAGVSLLRVHETLTTRGGSAVATRAVLAGCIIASVAMNVLHTPSRTLGGYLVAAVPPVLYAVLLELLLAKLTHTLAPKRSSAAGRMVRRAAVWAHFPAPMWRTLRNRLRQQVAAPLDEDDARVERPEQSAGHDGRSGPLAQRTGPFGGAHARVKRRSAVAHPRRDAAQWRGALQTLPFDSVQPAPPDGVAVPTTEPRRRGAKRAAFEAGLMAQLRTGDERVLSPDERVRNRAAYEVAASLRAPLSAGTARRYVVDALPGLRMRHTPNRIDGKAEPETV